MTILIVCGDASGDLHAGSLAKALREGASSRKETVTLVGVGGPRLRAQADRWIADIASQGISGFIEPLFKAGVLWRTFRQIRDLMAAEKPDAVICVDFYGFNRRVLGLARRFAVPSYYYIGPQVWASRPGRLKALSRLIRRAFLILPFEPALYRQAGIAADFVGHPLLDLVPQPLEKKLGKPFRIGLFPGSRKDEIRRHGPVLLEAYRLMNSAMPCRGFLFAPPAARRGDYPALEPSIAWVQEDGYDQRRKLDLALGSSGTTTIENALLGVPMVVLYKTSWITYGIARALIRVLYISMTNLLSGQALFPEFIQGRAKPEFIAQAGLDLLKDPAAYRRLQSRLLGLRGALGTPGAAARTAQAILADLKTLNPQAHASI